ncbi:hypothetical protein CEUSTIGMA_g550.t1 [Chlamydomonas eustigma]|uniref:Phosphatidylinositol N-acetylglucosaminyltransferase subunit H conserved domain-containing protein n=1 Tax=Chlamydomonas eustigma TaxID=1157962 RepID=A0A250WQH8_9CHLO|nr:hypothetical protein CEUSTIGMA_g550.t1 [Chlamydomonas eustigma]|eukprot:GAX73097.1 hypothetical protein CEUSTIGMA_g550.t1 [Chlamydomonas eustigma]
MRGMGVLLESYTSLGHKRNIKYLDFYKITSIFINEGLSSRDVQYYLAFQMEGEEKLVVAFPHILPNLVILKSIYSQVHDMIAAEKKRRCTIKQC